MPRKLTPDDPLQLERFLPYRLSVLANVVSATIASAYATRFDLTIPEWRVIAVLAREPGLSAAEVAERTAMDKVAVSRAVTRLLRHRRVARRAAATDRRRSSLALTGEGAAVYREVAPIALDYESQLLEALSSAESRTLDAALRKLLVRARDLAGKRIIRATTN
jgi:DNA-binding MarR family transcriptional regulator